MVPIMIFSSRDMGPIWRSFSAAAAGAPGVCVISGGASLYSSAGVMASPISAGTKAAYITSSKTLETLHVNPKCLAESHTDPHLMNLRVFIQMESNYLHFDE